MDQIILPAPKVMLFDWHGTLVDTHQAMYQAIEEMLPQLEELDLVRHILPDDQAKSEADEKLVHYIRIFRHLHPRVLAEQRISRTDIFDALFGDNQQANDIAHKAYNLAYGRFAGTVLPFQEGMYEFLMYLKNFGVKLGVVTNRSREFLDQELSLVDGGRWQDIFEVTLCGNEAIRYKPAPDCLLQASEALNEVVDEHVWYVGDSVTDMVTARKAGNTSIFYNGARWADDWFTHMFSEQDAPRYKLDAVVSDFDHLLDLVDSSIKNSNLQSIFNLSVKRPQRLTKHAPPPTRTEPDWHPALVNLTYPSVILFDWHATLVDTLDAMYHAVDDMLKELRNLGLLEHLVKSATCKSPEDVKLVEYVRDNLSLHPKIKLDRKISRTDIFEVLFGDNEAAKKEAHKGFTEHYRKYFGTALPFEPKVRDVLLGLKKLGFTLGVITNRDREFYMHELGDVDGSDWSDLFLTHVCGDDTERRKPHTDQIIKACDNLGCELGKNVWYVGDSTTDVIAAKSAGITSVFFNGALWDLPWLTKIFPGNERYPHKPDVVVNDFSEFWAMVLACRKRKNKK